MKTEIIGKNIEVTEALKNYVETKVSKLDNYFERRTTCKALLKVRKNRHTFELTIRVDGLVFRAEETSEDMYKSIDRSVDKLSRQVRKHKTKLMKRRLNGKESIRCTEIPVQKEEEEDLIVRRKSIQVSPMIEDEAILQMNLIGHDFFIYQDHESGNVNVIYTRKNGEYGVIDVNMV